MAMTGFGGFNQANQAALLQMQIRSQLGIPSQGLGLTSPGRPSTGGPGGVIGAQVSDQQQAQRIFAEIAAEQKFVNGQSSQNGVSNQYAPQQARPGAGNFQQMAFMLNFLMQTMMAMSQLGNGFSMFAGGPGGATPHYH